MEWRKIVDRWERSGLSAAAFADKHQLSKRSLSWWRWRLRSASRSTTRSPSAAALAFVPLVPTSAGPFGETSGQARWVLETGEGVRVEMSGATTLVVDGLGIALERVGRRA